MLQSSLLTVPYKFHAYNGNAQTVNTGSATKVTFETEVFDTGGNYDSVTNFRFTCPVAGFYMFGAGIITPATASLTRFITFLYKNNAEAHRLSDWGGASADTTGGAGSVLVQAAANDYFEIFVQPIGANVALATTANLTYFWGYLLSAS